MSKKPSIQPNTRIDRVKMVQLSCSFATNCRTKCYFSPAGQRRQDLIPLNSWVYSLKKKKTTFEKRRCIPNMRFVRDGAYSSAYWLIWRLRRPRFHDVPQISCTTWCEIQTFGFVNASILLVKQSLTSQVDFGWALWKTQKTATFS